MSESQRYGCPMCSGTGRGRLGGPCGTCRGSGELGKGAALAMTIAMLFVFAFVVYIAVSIAAH